MKILIFGATGFIGENLALFFSTDNKVDVAKISDDNAILINKIEKADVIINASGVSRSDSENDFFFYNIYHSQRIFSLINKFEDKMYIYFSSIHYSVDSIYGFSKRYNEFLLTELDFKEKNNFLCLRIPSIFGPGVKPNYVSVVATFCNNIVNKIDSNIINGSKMLKLLFIDDLIHCVNSRIRNKKNNGFELIELFPETVEISVNDLFQTIKNIGFNGVDINNKDKFLYNLFVTYNFYLNKL
ncbi:NAD-dependent epimerase/dehydratase family protein [Flavobacterium sp. LS1R49]|uniref:NAD-dependent epimerase/dehydratase family protein n=1 Tax=Flavobacterium shii TaxID=2987687 RepID=A0A9X2ZGS1_9FLAO|nr:NAD-dependent epimerase/dehydratase family protein [Flavobacterium shii]MCV9927428.1 NAD-dependent epimerase/dehydratase family protein [Flavobacterium shii]